MGLFDRKYCDVCGEKISLLGNRKLDDGNLCKDCANKLSPWFTGRKKSLLEDIRAQLEYRELNSQQLESFQETRVLGSNWKVHIDDHQGLLFVTNGTNWKGENPDLIPFRQITGCTVEVKQNTVTHTQQAPVGGPGMNQPGGAGRPGMNQPGRPGMGQPGGAGRPGMNQPGRPGMNQPGRPGMNQPGRPGMNQPGRQNMAAPGRPSMTRQPGGPSMNQPGGPGGQPRPAATTYETHTYDFYVTITLNGDWFQEIRFKINSVSVDENNTAQYQSMNYEAEQIRQAILAIAQNNLNAFGAANEPQVSVTCPHCGATTLPDANGCCEYCGGALNE